MWSIMIGILNVIFLICISNIHARSLSDVHLDENDLVVETTSGLVRGSYGGRTPIGNNPLYWFRGIPFAEPPVGNLRFQPPVPVPRWEGVLDVSEKRPECLQGGEDSIVGSEDCLYLKIYTTELPKEQKKLPVMVWIYGGAFFAGHPNFTNHSPDLLLDQGVIIVGLHYRLGIFGFLSTEDLVVPGNNGLKDQILALRWIKENIERFGGDPDNITIFGQSAGASSIGYLLQTPQTKGLFHRAILHSGTSLCLWGLSRQSRDLSVRVAQNLNLDTSSSQRLVDGLRTVDAVDLQVAQTDAMIGMFLSVNMREGLLFAPVVEPEHDGAVFTSRSHQQLENGDFHQVPIIMGYTSVEALLSEIPDVLRILLATYDLQPSRLVPIDMNIGNILTRSIIGREIRTQYFGSRMIATSNFEVMEFISNDQFARPIQETARLYSKRNPVYFYRFSHEGPLFGVTERNFPGVGHTEDLGYIFDFGHEGSEVDYLVRSQMVKLWTNFAKTGNPTPEVDPLLQGIQWPLFTENNLDYLEIDRGVQTLTKPDFFTTSFWRTLYERNGNPPYGTF
nr:carboxylesterase [Pharsalia antennata]